MSGLPFFIFIYLVYYRVYVTYLLKSDDASFNDLLSDMGQKVENGG
jgi:hypothetical protein